MNKVYGALDLNRETVRERDHVAHIDRFNDMFVIAVPIAKMEQEFDPDRDALGQGNEDSREPVQHFLFVGAIGVRLVALEACKDCRSDIELYRNLIVWKRGSDLVHLAFERVIVDGINCVMKLILQKQPNH